MPRALVITLLLTATAARAQQGDPPGAAKPVAVRTTRIAVLDVQYAGAGDRKTVEGLSALLASEVARRPSLTVIAGADLRALVGFERQKQLLGCTESSCIAELAGALGVAWLLSSEVSRVGSTWLLSLTLLDANKAVAQGRLTRKAYSDDQLVDETSNAVDELLKALPAAGAPVPRGTDVARAEPGAASPATGGGKLEPGFHQHDGLFLRFQLGFGGLKSAGGQTSLSGTAGSFAVALGFSPTDHLVLYGEIFDDVATSPTGTLYDHPISAGDGVTQTLVAYGIGAAWYFTSLNAYVSVTGGVGKVAVDATKATTITGTATSETGPMVRLSLGKEWWVSPNWGLGVSLSLESGSMKVPATTVTSQETWKSSAASIAFSATYN